jgi:hypothetical protein
MQREVRFPRLIPACLLSGLLHLVFIHAGLAQATSPSPATADKRAAVEMDRAALIQHLRSLGYRARGGIGRDKSESLDSQFRSFPHFSSSFTVKTVTYPFTMLGYPPRSGRTAHFRSVIVPLRMRFSGFGNNGAIAIDFDPTDAVTNMVNSPMYQDAQFANGIGQFGDMMQRATFWNKMDPQRHWHVRMESPRVVQAIDIEVTPETGTLFKVGGRFFGDVLIDFLDSQALTIIQLANIDPDEVPIFVTQNVTAEALGYHEAFSVSNPDGSETLQTLIYTSWLDPRFVDTIIADVSTFNHELLEWINDPFVNNIVPDWKYPPKGVPGSVCSQNPFLEVGDPQGNGPTFADFPTVPIAIKGVTYHLQDLVMLPWFADEIPSSAQNGWYDFPATNQITNPAVYCK